MKKLVCLLFITSIVKLKIFPAWFWRFKCAPLSAWNCTLLWVSYILSSRSCGSVLFLVNYSNFHILLWLYFLTSFSITLFYCLSLDTNVLLKDMLFATSESHFVCNLSDRFLLFFNWKVSVFLNRIMIHTSKLLYSSKMKRKKTYNFSVLIKSCSRTSIANENIT